MLHLGVDAHRRWLYVVAVDEAGQELGHWEGHNTAPQWATLLDWAEAFATPRSWGIEGSGHAGHGLAQLLVSQAEPVAEIPPNLTAAQRGRSRRRDKSDHDDARAIARVLRQEGDALPWVQPDDLTSQLAILTREREQLRVELTRERNRLHADLVRVDPDYTRQLPKLSTPAGLQAVLDWSPSQPDLCAQTALETAQRRVRRMQVLAADLDAVTTRIQTLSRDVCRPLTRMYGVGELSAGMLAAYLGPGDRFAGDAQIAKHAGVAPLETSSAGRTRHRLNRLGHRKLNEVIHRIALTQSRGYQPAKAYLARRQQEGKTWREAIRALKRHLARRIYHLWKECLANLGIPIGDPELAHH